MKVSEVVIEVLEHGFLVRAQAKRVPGEMHSESFRLGATDVEDLLSSLRGLLAPASLSLADMASQLGRSGSELAGVGAEDPETAERHGRVPAQRGPGSPF